MYTLKPNSGSLFANKQKQEGDNRPNATGPLLIECPHCKAQTRYDLSAWTKLPKRGGRKFMSLSVKVAKGGSGKPLAPPAEGARTDQPPGRPAEERVAF